MFFFNVNGVLRDSGCMHEDLWIMFVHVVCICGCPRVCVFGGEQVNALLAELDLRLAVIDSWAARPLRSPPTALFDACHIGQSVK